MKKIMIVQTPYQLIISMIIQKQYTNNEDQVDLVITDTFNGYLEIYKRMLNKKIFSNVYVAEIKDSLVGKSMRKILKKLQYTINCNYMIHEMLDSLDSYDEIYCGNYDVFTSNIRSYLTHKNKFLKFYLFEEAYTAYFPMDEIMPKTFFVKAIEYRNKLFGLKNVVREKIDGILLFEPNLLIYTPSCEILTIDRNVIILDKFKEDINDIFDVKEIAKKYDKKYIIFEEAIYSNSNIVDDEKIILSIAERVGKDNVLIKLHPRTVNDRFSKLGIKTLGSDGIPWEAIMLFGDFSNKVLIAISSAVITTCRILFGNNMNGYLLFKAFKNNFNQFDKKFDEFWNKLSSEEKDRGIHIPMSEEEFNTMLKQDASKL